MKKNMISIIGGSGFIGSRLCRRLSDAGLPFQILDKNISPFFPDQTIQMDIRDINSFREALRDTHTVINLAAEHRDDVTPKSLYDEVNVNGAENLVALCDELSIENIIFTSSVAVYGFATPGTDETGEINYFNDYGRTKWEAEKVYREWLEKDREKRSLTIVRPTVVFGERNRGNVYNLFKQISTGLFPMIGSGKNVKSMAYVENIAAFLHFNLNNKPGEHLFNYIDKPDFNMNELVKLVRGSLGKKARTGIHWPYFLGYSGGAVFDFLAFLTGKKFPISRIRIKKFCSDTLFNGENRKSTDFEAPVSLEEGISRTIRYEFLENAERDQVLFYSE
ncbi:NAD-dependent epimerase/dehydratase family protein [Spirochaeta isovalerica]|uniref:Nucleoside-diphosphate-sugar epimerase n=1 Tax=Spirochaeta isovalerica TaxID=150 RepID=A0A841RAI9_9SPIO|nr:NAD-dependent epimerase/dehydratase family protein [Spirochaeta isovalerica]MBB6480736.1 nucleoside-diphosphate-sugar epimerase [Spirochaeta isovalerica]